MSGSIQGLNNINTILQLRILTKQVVQIQAQ